MKKRERAYFFSDWSVVETRASSMERRGIEATPFGEGGCVDELISSCRLREENKTSRNWIWNWNWGLLRQAKNCNNNIEAKCHCFLTYICSLYCAFT